MLLAACGDDGDEEAVSVETSPGSTAAEGLPSCEDVSHAVVFGVFGTLTMGDGEELAQWTADPAVEPVVRPGAADVVQAYRALGYDLLYVTSQEAATAINGQPLDEALTVWLGANGFPIGEETNVWAWGGEGDASVSLMEELAGLSSAGTSIDAGYASDPDVVFPLATGGIPRASLYTVGEAADEETSTSLPDEDLGAHLSEVESLEPVCE